MFKFLLFFLPAYSLFAITTLTVTLSSDNNPGGIGDVGDTPDRGDLRYCLNTMNANLNASLDDYYQIAFAFPMTIQLNGILPIINNSSNLANITIGNSDPSYRVVIDGNDGAYRGFFIPKGIVTIQNIVFQNMCAQGGTGGDGISGGGGGMGAGGAIYAPQLFLNGSSPSIRLMNVLINSCSAIGGAGGNYSADSITGNEGGGGGGGFSGNGGSVTTSGVTGGAGGGGFGGDGGNVTLSTESISGGGGGGGGGIGSKANTETPTNLGNGGSDVASGTPGSGYNLSAIGGSGGGGNLGGSYAGGGGGGSPTPIITYPGGGGGGSSGSNGTKAYGTIAPGGEISQSGGNGGDGGGGGGAGVVFTAPSSSDTDGKGGDGGYGGGGGGGAGTGAYDRGYSVAGGKGGVGGGGGGGGVDQSGTTPSSGGNSLGGGGGGGGGPSSVTSTEGGHDKGYLGGGSGGSGANSGESGIGGGGGGGGSGLGGAIFVDSGLNFTIQALPGVPTNFDTTNTSTTAGNPGVGAPGAADGSRGFALGNSIFLRSTSTLTLLAENEDDLLILGEGVSFVDDTEFILEGTTVEVTGNGTIIYNGATTYSGTLHINNANFKLNGIINDTSVSVSRDISYSAQRGKLSGRGTLTGSVKVNSGIISPDANQTLTLGSLILNSANPDTNTLESIVHAEINSAGTSLISVTGAVALAGTLEIDLDRTALPGTYILLTSSGITNTFDSISFVGPTPNYSISYLPRENPTFIQFELKAPPLLNLQGAQMKNTFAFEYELYNELTWGPSLSNQTIGYFIFRDGEKIATLDAQTTTYLDHNRKKNLSYTYSITSFDASGNESIPETITINP